MLWRDMRTDTTSTKGASMDCWQNEIRRASTETEVVRMAADYLTLWAEAELEPLTQGWRDFTIESAEDVERMKRWLVESVNTTQSLAPNATELRELASYFWHAAVRIGEIRDSQRVLH
jgi:hypothetical protein